MKNKSTLLTWIVLTNDTGMILAVYGSALLDVADEKQAALESAFARPIHRRIIHSTYPAKPRVGQTVDHYARRKQNRES